MSISQYNIKSTSGPEDANNILRLSPADSQNPQASFLRANRTASGLTEGLDGINGGLTPADRVGFANSRGLESSQFVEILSQSEFNDPIDAPQTKPAPTSGPRRGFPSAPRPR